MGEVDNASISAAVTARIVAKRLTTEELLRFCNVVVFEEDPRGMEGYEKVASLFSINDGTVMHGDTFVALQEIAQERLLTILNAGK